MLDNSGLTSGEDRVSDVAGMSFERLREFLSDIDAQPQWRKEADKASEYYDSNQFDSETMAELEERGIPPIVVNMIRPTIDLVTGIEIQNRTDWRVTPELGKRHEDLAEALTSILQKASRKMRASRKLSRAYKSQVISGIGWVSVQKNTNPFEYPYRLEYIHRREIYWDWRAKEDDLSDARYLVRRKWYDTDQLEMMFPEHKDLIKNVIADWSGANDWTIFERHPQLFREKDLWRDYPWPEEEWRDSYRRRVALYEVWYRTWHRGEVMLMPDNRVLEFDPENPIHKAAVLSDKVELREGVFPKVRLAWWIGPHRVHDQPSPYPHGQFPYIPFWGYVEDNTGTPYGLVRPMIPLQDEINARRSKMMWLLSARQTVADENAVSDHNAAAQEVARADAYIIKRQGTEFRIDANMNLSSQQFNVYQDSKQTMQDVGGVYQQMRGQSETGRESGVALQQLIEQGSTTLAELNENFRDAKERVGRQLMSIIVHDIGQRDDLDIPVEDVSGAHKKVVRVNHRQRDEQTGIEYRDNDVLRTRINLELTEAPQTPTFRKHQLFQITELVRSMPPDMQMQMMDIVVDLMDIPNKSEVKSRVQRMLGIQPDPSAMTDEERQQWEAEQQEAERQQAMQRERDELELAEKAMDLELKGAQVHRTNTQAVRDWTGARQQDAKAEAEMAESGVHIDDNLDMWPHDIPPDELEKAMMEEGMPMDPAILAEEAEGDPQGFVEERPGPQPVEEDVLRRDDGGGY